MVRGRARVEEDHGLVGGLPNPFPSSPHRLPTHGIVISCKGRKFSTNFSACYAARRFVDLLVEGDLRSCKRVSDEKLRTPDGVLIESPELEEILRHKLSLSEKRWDLPGHYQWQAFYVATGRRLNLKRSPSYEIPPYSKEISYSLKRETSEVSNRVSGDVVVTPRNPPDHSLRRGSGNPARTPRNSGGEVSISDICAEIGMEPSKGRRILRARSDLSHIRQGRWAWDERDAMAIKEILRKSK